MHKNSYAVMCDWLILESSCLLAALNGNGVVQCLYHMSEAQVAGLTFFRLRLRSCSKIFESLSGSEVFTKLRIRHLFRLCQPSMQLKFSNVEFKQ